MATVNTSKSGIKRSSKKAATCSKEEIARFAQEEKTLLELFGCLPDVDRMALISAAEALTADYVAALQERFKRHNEQTEDASSSIEAVRSSYGPVSMLHVVPQAAPSQAEAAYLYQMRCMDPQDQCLILGLSQDIFKEYRLKGRPSLALV